MSVARYLRVDLGCLKSLRGDPAAMFWYEVLLDYSRTFKPDKHGYIRISKQVVYETYGFNVRQVRYLNEKLCKANLLKIDTAPRGKRTPIGYMLT